MKNSEKIKQIINALVLQAREAGLPGFVVGFKHPDDAGKDQYYVHFENVKLNDAVNISAFSWRTAIRSELQQHPEYKPEFKAIFEEGLADFDNLVKKINQRVEDFRRLNPEAASGAAGIRRGKPRKRP